jgi:hypothetical protein
MRKQFGHRPWPNWKSNAIPGENGDAASGDAGSGDPAYIPGVPGTAVGRVPTHGEFVTPGNAASGDVAYNRGNAGSWDPAYSGGNVGRVPTHGVPSRVQFRAGLNNRLTA